MHIPIKSLTGDLAEIDCYLVHISKVHCLDVSRLSKMIAIVMIIGRLERFTKLIFFPQPTEHPTCSNKNNLSVASAIGSDRFTFLFYLFHSSASENRRPKTQTPVRA